MLVTAASSDPASVPRTWAATLIAGFMAEIVVPGFVAVDLARPVFGAVLDSRAAAPEGPISTASPDT